MHSVCPVPKRLDIIVTLFPLSTRAIIFVFLHNIIWLRNNNWRLVRWTWKFFSRFDLKTLNVYRVWPNWAMSGRGVFQQNPARSYRKESEAPAFTNFGDLLYTSTLYDRNHILHGNQTFRTKMEQFYRFDYAPSTLAIFVIQMLTRGLFPVAISFLFSSDSRWTRTVG